MTKTPLQKTIEMWEVLAETAMTKLQYFSRAGIPPANGPYMVVTSAKNITSLAVAAATVRLLLK